MDNTAALHVVLGAGQLGPLVAARLRARGLRVRLVRRGPFVTGAPPGVEAVSGDLGDPTSATALLAGAAVVYHCASPPYTEWRRALLPLTEAILTGASRAGAHLVALDNLYMYGRAPGGRMSEDSPVAPCSKKGELRARAAGAMTAARDRGDLPVTIGRASDFIGPGATLAAVFGDRFWTRAFAGKPGEVLGDPDQPHSYSYVPDVADALVTLGTDPRARNQLWHLPAPPALPTRAIIQRIGQLMGQPLAATSVPTWLLRGLGLWSPLMREIAEMTYQWRAPFVLDDARYRHTFGVGATPWEVALPATVAWARGHYLQARAAPVRSAAAPASTNRHVPE
jgi:nucleoside-diphosphate-sugar epimerase